MLEKTLLLWNRDTILNWIINQWTTIYWFSTLLEISTNINRFKLSTVESITGVRVCVTLSLSLSASNLSHSHFLPLLILGTIYDNYDPFPCFLSQQTEVKSWRGNKSSMAKNNKDTNERKREREKDSEREEKKNA